MCDALRLYFRPEDARITSQNHYLYFSLIFAPVAELADAQDLKSCCSDTVPVRFRSAALSKNGRNVEITAFLLFFCFKMFEHL